MSYKKQVNYKKTEIGEIPEEWKIARLSDYAKINPKRELLRGIVTTYVGMANIQSYERKISSYETKPYNGGSRFINGDTLLARITPCLENGKTGYVDILENDDVSFGSSEFIILTNKLGKTTSKFIYYLTRSPRLRNIAIKSMVGSSGRQRVQVDELSNSLFAFPGLEEQQQIASILSSLDDKIELNRKMNRVLEEMGKAIFKHWFVDFEFPNNQGKPYKSSGGEMVDSEFGEIPKGWKVENVGDFCKVRSGYAFRSSVFKRNAQYGVLKIKSIIDPNVGLNDVKYVDSKDVNERARQFILKEGDILIAMSGNTTGKIGLMPSNKTKYVLNQRAGKYFFTKKQNIFKWFVYLFLRTGKTQQEIIQSAYGSAQPNISPSILENMSIISPPTSTTSSFNNKVEALMTLLLKNYGQIEYLSRIRDSLLPKLMRGRLKVN